jgi:hypothetical protein
LIVCFLGVVVVSNRPFVTAHLSRFNQVTRLQSPVDPPRSPHAPQSLFVAEFPEDSFPDGYAQRNGMDLKTDGQPAIEVVCVALARETDAIFGSPVQVSQSVLNL